MDKTVPWGATPAYIRAIGIVCETYTAHHFATTGHANCWEEEPEEITVDAHADLIDPHTNTILDEIHREK